MTETVKVEPRSIKSWNDLDGFWQGLTIRRQGEVVLSLLNYEVALLLQNRIPVGPPHNDKHKSDGTTRLETY
jgi:hypothetical protein